MPKINHEARWRRLQARMDAQAAQRHAARLAEAAKPKALPLAEFNAAMDQLAARITEVAPQFAARIAESEPPAADPLPAKVPHEMTREEFRAYAVDTWTSAGQHLNSPMWRTGAGEGGGE
ncbi:hypothetical protein GXW83_27470 [Streptacidiphilus sp. PB12-B1b]|uniref:hypothetical protein n=1 Tax=Streptacidiphilus sp. PB12-B1b TaxID=2705012 RepID=UPI0015FAC699|nr:hypothetical protein [Streptacidiphilus sp. PB12-B1b]QMU78885.1 hypothetical protein GXW83_27470 [Streptacidiphilus sp. PB12-B1b]